MKEGESKKRRVERGRESLVKWNLVTDAIEGGAALQGRVEVLCVTVACVCVCVSAWSRVNARARVLHLCAQARAGKGQDMSVH